MQFEMGKFAITHFIPLHSYYSCSNFKMILIIIKRKWNIWRQRWPQHVRCSPAEFKVAANSAFPLTMIDKAQLAQYALLTQLKRTEILRAPADGLIWPKVAPAMKNSVQLKSPLIGDSSRAVKHTP